MNNEKKIIFMVHWKQSYPELEEMIFDSLEYELAKSNFKEANELIERVKNRD